MPGGVFISLEGIDGCGKSSLKEGMLEFLLPYDPLSLREPGGTEISERIRELLLDASNDGIHARTEAFLYASARCQLVESVIRPALQAGQIVIADRFMDSTLAYQGYGRGLPLDFLGQLNQLCTGGLAPDITLLLDLDPEEGQQRRAQNVPDRLEKEGILFQTRVRQGYLQMADLEPERIITLDASLSPQAVLEQALAAIRPVLEQKGWIWPE